MAPVADVGRVAGFADGLGLPEWPRLPSGARAGLDGPVLGFGVAHDHCAHLVLVGSCHVAVSRAVTGGSVRLFDLGHSGLGSARAGAFPRGPCLPPSPTPPPPSPSAPPPPLPA